MEPGPAVVGFGLDVVAVARIARILEGGAGTARRFLTRCFTEREQLYCDGRRDRATRYAARFAAKEATVKALGAPPGVRWTDIEVVRDEGAPRLVLSGAAQEACALRSVGRIHLSLTHDAGIAVAGVVLEGSGRRP
jgi:holo-[acyl-carrier protein] synthase